MASVVNGYVTAVNEDNLDPMAATESSSSLDCAWCGSCFEDISDLLGHVDTEHLDDKAAA
jgi:hypothetical protein